MLNRVSIFLNRLTANPQKIFLVDAFGALLTTISLFGIIQLKKYFGMPSKALYILSITAFCLFIYSISCWRFMRSNWKLFLGVLIACNSLYALGSLGLVIFHFEKLTKLGFIYFLLESIIIGIIVRIEYKLYSN